MSEFKTALILGGGGVRGFAHVGILKTLEANKIKIDLIAGCSMGAIIGYFLAAGKNPIEIENFILTAKVYKLLNFSVSRLGIKNTDNLRKILEDFAGVKNFEDLKIPLYINATNISLGREEIFSQGEIFPALRASISVPGVFAPYKIGDYFYLDGGVLDQNPFLILPRDKYKYIIANVSPVGHLNGVDNLNLINVLGNSIKLMQNEISDLKLEKLNKDDFVVIKPAVENYGIIQKTDFFADIIKKGEMAAMDKLMEIKKSLRF